jgi:glycosyltransferase involved in cell wall biosynthesis
VKISVFINTLNEEKNIRRCLESVKWADEIVVVDMHSDDRTAAIAREYTDKVFLHERCGYADPARAFAVAQTSGDWIMHLDADEMATDALRRRLLQIASDDAADIVRVPLKNFFWGRQMTACGLGPLQYRPIRFHKRDAVMYRANIHAYSSEAKGARVVELEDQEECFLHFASVTPQQYFDKLNNYTTLEAAARFRRGETMTFSQMLSKAWTVFWKRWFKKSKGYRDKDYGFVFCLWSAVYETLIWLKLDMMHRYKTEDLDAAVRAKYDAIAQDELKKFAADVGR